MTDEYEPNESDAVDCAIKLLKGNYTGNSDFDKGMRALQDLFKKQHERMCFLGGVGQKPARERTKYQEE